MRHAFALTLWPCMPGHDSDGVFYFPCADRNKLSIPVMDTSFTTLSSELGTSQQSILKPVAGAHRATAVITRQLEGCFADTGSELQTTITVHSMFYEIFRILSRHSNISRSIAIHLNRTMKATGSRSSAVTMNDRPDTQAVYNMATLMIGADKVDCMLEAINDLKWHVHKGLGAGQYGDVPGILGYAASGLQLQFCYISRAGEVRCQRPFSGDPCVEPGVLRAASTLCFPLHAHESCANTPRYARSRASLP